ncbi:hypothetical protein ASE76_05335 [Xylophilus sp. Leaf220]|nr:hypothetical protein ASE76_05335 [Xylophilus sp. Leaf220]
MPDGDSTNDADTVDVASTTGSDVGITKTRPSAVVAQNSNVSYTLTPRFYGGVAPGATGSGLITVTDTLDPSLAFVSASGPGWTCTGTPGNPTVTCTRPGPYAGGNFTNMPAITLVATATGLGSVPNTAAIAIPETDPDTANDTSTVNVTSTNEANLRVGKTGPGFPVAVGQTFNYTLPVTNDGPLAVGATQTITVVDTIPAGITVVAAPAAGSSATWICNTNGQTLTCQRTGALAANATSTLIVAARADVAGSTTNTVNCPSLSGTFPVSSTNPGNQCGSATVLATAVVDSADLQIQKAVVAGSETVIAGENLSYRLTVTNNGTAAATNVTVSDTLASLVGTGGFQSATPSQGACTPNNVTNGSSVALSCNLGTMGPNTTQSVLVVVRPSIVDTGSRGNTATVNSPQVGDTDRTNNTSSVSSTVTAKVDIVALKTATPSTVPAGAPITYQASVRNDGPSTAQTVRLTDTLPANAAFMNLVSVSNGGSCTTVPAVDSVGGSLVCAWANVPNGQQYTATYRVRPLGTRTGAAYDAVVNNVAVTTATLETQTGNNSATTSTAVVAPQLDILVNKVDSIDPVELGQPTTYTVTISNGGPSYGTNLRMVDVFPAPGSAPSAVFSYRGALTVDNGGTCVEPAIGTTSGTLTCSFPGIASGAVATVTYQMRAESLTAAGSTSGTGFNKVTVQVNEVETQTANNDRTESTTTRRAQIATDLQITKSGPATGIAGGNLAYTLLVRNNGPLASDGAQVRDALPAGTTFDSGAGCTEAGGTVTCLVGPLAVNGTRSFAVTLKLANPYTGASPLSNTATVDAPGDAVPGNNSSTATTTVSAAPNATSVPTLSEWGVMLLSALVGVFALAARRRGLAG